MSGTMYLLVVVVVGVRATRLPSPVSGEGPGVRADHSPSPLLPPFPLPPLDHGRGPVRFYCSCAAMATALFSHFLASPLGNPAGNLMRLVH